MVKRREAPSRRGRWIAAAVIPVALAATVTLTGCNLDPCQHHGGIHSQHWEGNQEYYQCNDGTTV